MRNLGEEEVHQYAMCYVRCGGKDQSSTPTPPGLQAGLALSWRKPASGLAAFALNRVPVRLGAAFAEPRRHKKAPAAPPPPLPPLRLKRDHLWELRALVFQVDVAVADVGVVVILRVSQLACRGVARSLSNGACLQTR
eukprot:scaffold869_cov303-Pinguiococcus_pyrenoidosus.AAC.26